VKWATSITHLDVLLFSILSGCDVVCCRETVVMCLSEHVRNDTLLDKPHRVPKACRNQLKFELLQRVSLHSSVVIFDSVQC